MTDVIINKLNNSFLTIRAETSTIYEIADNYTFEKEGSKYDKRVKAGLWDGKVRIFNKRDRTLPLGLLNNLTNWLTDNNYEFEVNGVATNDIDVVNDIVEKWSNKLPKEIDGLPLEKRDFQLDSVKEALIKKRILIESPTSSGKSLIIYGICSCIKGRKLIIVPSINLVRQMAGDFVKYGYEHPISEIFFNSKSNNKEQLNNICVSTWQSLQNAPSEWFEQFNVVIGDEAHQAGAKEVKRQIEASVNAEYKIGTTGTLPSDPLQIHTLMGLFGEVYTTITTREMIDMGVSANVTIFAVKLKYDKKSKDHYKEHVKSYSDELKWLAVHPKRNRFIKSIVDNCKGNTLVLFRNRIHGRMLEETLSKSSKKIFYVDGTVNTDYRDNAKVEIEKADDAVFVASFKTSGTGLSIRRLHNLLVASPSKSETGVPQFLGRGLRIGRDKNHLNFFDIGDNISNNNFAWNHFKERIKMYTKIKLNIKFIEIDL